MDKNHSLRTRRRTNPSTTPPAIYRASNHARSPHRRACVPMPLFSKRRYDWIREKAKYHSREWFKGLHCGHYAYPLASFKRLENKISLGVNFQVPAHGRTPVAAGRP